MQTYRLGEGPYGSAYQGTLDDIFAAGDLAPVTVGNRTFGLFLGHFDWLQTIRHVWQVPKKGIWAWLKDERESRDHVETIPQVHDFRFTGDPHHLVVAATGADKFRDVLAPMLLYDGSCETSCLIIDPKGEIASVIGPALDAPGARDPRTVILDPWDLCGTGLTYSLTLLDGIRLDNPHCVKDARVLADAIIVQRGEDDGHWVETAKNFLTGLLLFLGTDPREEDARHLRRLREIVTLPWDDLVYLLGAMIDSREFGGMVARAGQAMLNRDEKERRNILSTIERDTAFIEDPNLWKAIETSSVDLNRLVLSNKRLHVIVPFDYTKEMRSWLRLAIAAYYNACLRNRLDPNLPSYLRFRHIIIDEFAGLGRLDFIVKDIAEARGAGIKYHLVVQSLNQLFHLYDKGWETFVSNSFIQAFGINDHFTADYLSKLCGQATVVTESKALSESRSESESTSWGSGASSSATSGGTGPGSKTSGTSSNLSRSTSTSTSTSTTQTFSTTGRPVLMPDEIRRLPADRQLLFLRGLPVLMARRAHYDETFRALLPAHKLSEVLKPESLKLLTDAREVRPLSIEDASRPSPRATVNASLRETSFKAPAFRPYSLGEALRQSPREVGAALLLVIGLVAFTVEQVRSSIAAAEQRAATALATREQEAQEAERRAAAARLAAERAAADAERARLDRIAAADRETAAKAIDDRLRAPYGALAGRLVDALTQIRLCSSPPAFDDPVRCQETISYAPGTLAPVALRFSTKPEAYRAEFRLAPANIKRGGALDGAAATLAIHTTRPVTDLASLPGEVGRALEVFLTSFDVPGSLIAACTAPPGSLSKTFGATTAACHFDDLGVQGRRLTLTLSYPLSTSD